MNLDFAARTKLVQIARTSIESGLTAQRWTAMPALELPAEIQVQRSSFVTLRIEGRLRGCCGNLNAHRALAEEVWRSAWAAAFADPRFPPLEAEEWGDTDLHISVLSPLEPLPVRSEEELLGILRPHIDGLVLERDEARATFLPDVWSSLPEPRDFVAHLKQKAGWPATSWSPQIKVWRYTTVSFGAAELAAVG